MINLNLGPEPAALTASRLVNLPIAVAAFNAIVGTNRKAFAKTLDVGYQVARKELYARQHAKCAFCEKSLDESHQPVEHFRPKKAASTFENGKWVRVTTHYWWLAWSWENLYFACNDCNGSKRKGIRFPVKANSIRSAHLLAPVTEPINVIYYSLAKEDRLLIDPRTDDPFEHLRWLPTNHLLPKEDWIWTIQGRDERGAMTINVLELTRRIDEVNRHLRGLKSMCLDILRHVRQGRIQHGRNQWSSVVQIYVDDVKQPFRNASWWALSSLCPINFRNVHGFSPLNKPIVTYP